MPSPACRITKLELPEGKETLWVGTFLELLKAPSPSISIPPFLQGRGIVAHVPVCEFNGSNGTGNVLRQCASVAKKGKLILAFRCLDCPSSARFI